MSRVDERGDGSRSVRPARTAGLPGPLAGLRGQEVWLAPGLALVGLVVVAVVTIGLFQGRLPSLPLPGGGGATPRPTPNPSIVVPAKKTVVLGTIVFAKGGDLWAASGSDVTILTKTGTDSSPAWTADGASIYVIETRAKVGTFPSDGVPSQFTLEYPVIDRLLPDGSGRQQIANSLYTTGPGGRYTYHVWYLQPAPDPKGGRIAIVSDGPNPIGHDPVIQTMPLAGGKLTNLNLPFTPSLGLGDPTWRRDGGALAYTRYDRSGFLAAHRIDIYDVTTKKVRVLTGPGFTQPSWSPDGRYIAAVHWNGDARDVVILDATSGAVVTAVTSDGESWAPVWSPAGDAIAFLTASGLVIDLDMVQLKPGGTSGFALGDRLPITQDSQLDGSSRPTWFIPAALLPTPSPPPTPSPTPLASPSSPGPSATP